MAPSRLLSIVLLMIQSHTMVNSHGNMVKPMAWWDKNQAGWNFDEEGKNTNLGCGVLDLPTDTEFDEVNGADEDCMKFWFADSVTIPGNKSLPDSMLQPESTCINQAGANDHDKKFPWYAPGTAPVYSPCGTMGAKPFGCNNDGEGKFGDCCNTKCGVFAMGQNAENYEWPDMPLTEWVSGSYQEVAWYVGANHAGGYSYRLCKLPEEGIGGLTEECFQQNPLEFSGDEQWVEYQIDRNTQKRTELKALQTTDGTFPEGSMWRANPLLPNNEEGGSTDYGSGHVIDYVKVPSDLEPGEYVVSFRWDCKCSPQVWGACANILIV